ncbi:ABC transporter permease [Pelagicoccus sp. SDUM812003]|uniref:ABC transporter permease n=1 Tax=Pelagicoccus sp. SDUM812003 TaxID=3041267 RepID=UPI00280FB52A|nr:ABC transporter permease [Pelagicoccus sp. SDUM812003]MDQ8202251.1 ABC transporter permease [Pelagicoccus sp. SDUM812003]
MNFRRLVLINVSRHWVRSLIGCAGIAFGVAAMLTVLSVVLGAIGMFERILSNDSHYLVFERNVSDLFFSSVPEEAVEVVRRFDLVESANPMLFGIVSSDESPVITCFGVSAQDPRMRDSIWLEGEKKGFGEGDRLIYLGSRAAAFLEARIGDEVPIGKELLTVGGVLKMENGFEDGGVFMPLPLAQEFFHREGYCSVVSVKLKDRDQGEAFEAAVSARYDDLIALENEEFSQSYSQFKILSATAWAVGVCAFLLGGMGVANTMLMSVFSRIREIAILRVAGFSKSQVGLMIIGESLLLAIGGSTAGFGIGYLALLVMKNIPQLNGYVSPLVEAPIVAGVVAVAFLTSVAGSLYPAWHATRIQPAEALRYE